MLITSQCIQSLFAVLDDMHRVSGPVQDALYHLLIDRVILG